MTLFGGGEKQGKEEKMNDFEFHAKFGVGWQIKEMRINMQKLRPI